MDGYIRVSRVAGRGGSNFISPDVQRDQIERWASFRDVPILSWHTDLDQSGAKTSRPALDEALRRVETGESGGIVVAKLDRFARSITAALEGIKRILDAGGQFTSVAEGIDPTTPAGKLQQNIMLVFAEFELDRIREAWAIAQERAVARGVHIASRTPTGYVRGEDGRLAPHPDDEPHIRELFERRARGEGWGTLAAFLTDRKVTGPYGAPQWTARAVTHIIANRVYLGEARSGRHVNPLAHSPIVDHATWDRAQTAPTDPVSRSHQPALLSGLARCAGCRHLLKPDRQTMRDGARVRTYRCRGKHAGGTCEGRAMVLGSVIEPWVERAFLDEIDQLAAGPVGEDLTPYELAVKSAEIELVRFRDNERVASAIGDDLFVDGITARARALDEARDALQAARAKQAPTTHGDLTLIHDLWPELEVVEKQRIMRSVIDTVFVRSVGQANVPIADRALILWAGEAPEGLPARGRRVGVRPFVWPADRP